jgi:hypothetical protein
MTTDRDDSTLPGPSHRLMHNFQGTRRHCARRRPSLRNCTLPCEINIGSEHRYVPAHRRTVDNDEH